MLLCTESYICISVCMFSHDAEFWYCRSTSVNFTRLGPYLSNGIRFDLVSTLVWLVSAGAAALAGQAVRGSRAETKQVRNVKGHILGRWSLISSQVWAMQWSTPSLCFLGITQLAPVLSLLLPDGLQGFPNQAHSFIFYVPFCKSFSWLTALNNLFFFFLHLFWPVFFFLFLFFPHNPF